MAFDALSELVVSGGGVCTSMRFDGSPRGLFATEPIAADTLLLSIPLSRLLVAHTPDPDALLRQLLFENARKDSSMWSAYLRILPSRHELAETLPFFWTPTQIAALQCPAIEAVVKGQHSMVKARFAALVASDPELCPTWEAYTWAWAVLESRSSCIIHDDATELQCLMPMGDTFNHHSTYPSVLARYDAAKRAMTFTTLRDVGVDQQLFVQYGAHDDLTLLVSYGFVWRGPSSSWLASDNAGDCDERSEVSKEVQAGGSLAETNVAERNDGAASEGMSEGMSEGEDVDEDEEEEDEEDENDRNPHERCVLVNIPTRAHDISWQRGNGQQPSRDCEDEDERVAELHAVSCEGSHDPEGQYYLTREGPSPSLRAALQLEHMTSDERASEDWPAAVRDGNVISMQNERAVWKATRMLVTGRLVGLRVVTSKQPATERSGGAEAEGEPASVARQWRANQISLLRALLRFVDGELATLDGRGGSDDDHPDDGQSDDSRSCDSAGGDKEEQHQPQGRKRSLSDCRPAQSSLPRQRFA